MIMPRTIRIAIGRYEKFCWPSLGLYTIDVTDLCPGLLNAIRSFSAGLLEFHLPLN